MPLPLPHNRRLRAAQPRFPVWALAPMLLAHAQAFDRSDEITYLVGKASGLIPYPGAIRQTSVRTNPSSHQNACHKAAAPRLG